MNRSFYGKNNPDSKDKKDLVSQINNTQPERQKKLQQNEKIILSNLPKVTDNSKQQITSDALINIQNNKLSDGNKSEAISPGLSLNYQNRQGERIGQNVQARVDQMKIELQNQQKREDFSDENNYDDKKYSPQNSIEVLNSQKKNISPLKQSPEKSPNRQEYFRYDGSGGSSSESQRDDFVLKKKLQILENNAKFFESQANPLFKENQQLKDQMIQLNEIIKVKTMDFALLVRSEDEKGQSRDMIKKIGDLEAIYKVIKDDINFYIREVEQFSRDNQQLKYDHDKLQGDYKEQDRKNQKDNEMLKVSYSNLISGLESKVADLRIQIENLERELVQERRDKERIRKEKDTEIHQLKITIENLRNEVKQLDDDSTKKIKELNQVITQNLENFEKEKKELIQKYEEQLSKQKANYENQINKLTQNNTSHVNSLLSELEQKNILIQSLQSEISQLQGNSSQEIQQLIHKLATTNADLDKQKNDNQALRSDLHLTKKRNEELLREKQQINEELERLRRNYKFLEEEFRDYREKATVEIDDLKRQITQLENEIKRRDNEWRQKFTDEVDIHSKNSRKQFDEMRDKYELEIRKLKEQLEGNYNQMEQEKLEIIRQLNKKIAELEDENQKLKLKLKSINTEWEMKFKDMENSLKKKINGLEAEMQFSSQQNDSKLRRQLEELEELRQRQLKELEHKKNVELDELESSKDEKYRKLELQFIEMKNQLTNQLSDLESERLKRINQLEQELKNIRKELEERRKKELQDQKNYYEEQIKRLKASLEGQTKEAVQTLESHYQREMDKVKDQYEEKIRKMNRDYESKINQITFEYENKLKELRTNLDKERRNYDQLKEEFLKSKEKYENEIKDLKQIKEQNEKTIHDLQQKINKLEEELRLLKIEFAKYQKDHENDFEKLKQEYIAREKQLQQKMEDELNKELENHLKFIEKMKKEYENLIHAHKNRVEELNIELRDLERLFAERPSRPDDIKQIKLLLKELELTKKKLAETDIKILHANEIVKYLQLELENYKNIYEIFGPNKRLPPEIEQGIINGTLPEVEISSPVKQNITTRQSQMNNNQIYQKKRNKSMNGIDTTAYMIGDLVEQQQQQEKLNRTSNSNTSKNYNSTSIQNQANLSNNLNTTGVYVNQDHLIQNVEKFLDNLNDPLSTKNLSPPRKTNQVSEQNLQNPISMSSSKKQSSIIRQRSRRPSSSSGNYQNTDPSVKQIQNAIQQTNNFNDIIKMKTQNTRESSYTKLPSIEKYTNNTFYTNPNMSNQTNNPIFKPIHIDDVINNKKNVN
ncbi:hypothetical protein ABPG74_005538 [Tetrahymena malaccensis]